MTTTATHLPAGVANKATEVFLKDSVLMAFHNGKVLPFFELPSATLQTFADYMHQDVPAMEVFKRYGLKRIEDQLFTYCKCKFGGFNHEADLDEAGKLAGEHWNCGSTCNCILKPVLRNQMQVKNGHLSQREIDVIQTIAEGLTISQSADKLFISERTFNNHKTNIFRKVGVQSSVELTVWALNQNFE